MSRMSIKGEKAAIWVSRATRDLIGQIKAELSRDMTAELPLGLVVEVVAKAYLHALHQKAVAVKDPQRQAVTVEVLMAPERRERT
jgi:hypothetical protein